MRTHLNRLILLILLVPFVIACATTSSGTSTTSTAAAVASSAASTAVETPAGAATIDEAVTAVWNAMQTRNEARMRTYMPIDLLRQIGTQQWRGIMSCVPDGSTVTLAGHTVETTDNTAKVTVNFNVSSNGGTPSTLTKVWTFYHAPNGGWVLLTLPGCPLK